MSKIYNLIYISAALAILFACSKKETADSYGFLSVNIDSEKVPEIVVKGDKKPEKVFSLTIINKKTGEKHIVKDFRSLSSEPLKLSSGTYTVTANSGEIINAAWNSPVYSGSTDIIIRPEQINTANITCKLANTMVTATLPKDIDKYFSDYKITVNNGTGKPLIFSKSDDNIKDTAYFAVTGKLTWLLSLKNNDGMTYSTSTITRENVKAGQHYSLIFKIGQAGDVTGGAAVMISVDDVLNEKTYPLLLDFSKSNLPSITATDFSITNPISSPMGSLTTKTIKFSAPQGIKSISIVTSDKKLMEAGLPMGIELVDAEASSISNLNNAGIAASAIPFGSTSANIEISKLVSRLNIGKYSFTINLIDIKNHGTNADINLNITPPVDAEASSAIPWGRFAIVSGQWFAESRPAGIKFQYRKSSDSQWIDSPATISFDDAQKTFSAELWGLESNTEYIFKAISDKDKSTREITFKTETAEDVRNLSFDDWYQNGSCWYPNATSENKDWDSANPGTKTMGVIPTKPEENDVAVPGTGKKAARLESSIIPFVRKFAAGNIYTGQFVKVSGMGAILNWGYKFNSRPIALKGYYKYLPKIIDNAEAPYTSLKGTTDNCHIKIFLTDWNGMFEINTNKKVFVSDQDEHIIALGQLISSKENAEYVHFTIPLEYRNNTKKPNFIVITGAASRYGDYFTGAVGSVLLLDEFSLTYDPSELTENERDKVKYR